MFEWLLGKISSLIVAYLRKPVWNYVPFSITSPKILEQYLQPGDVLLVEGNLRISTIIKYLTQSTWSHAALYIGRDENDTENAPHDALDLIEAEADGGVKCVSINKYKHFNTRICRPHSLTPEEKEQVISYARARVGHQYDMKNIIDLGRYLLPYPPVPVFFRRRMLAIGSGDPTRAICSTLIAEAFHNVNYPILPQITRECIETPQAESVLKEIYHIRHHSLFTPRDFDLSPYFKIIKPTLESGFDHKLIKWSHIGDPT